MTFSQDQKEKLTQQQIKAIHMKEIYLHALKQGGISRASLRQKMKLSFPSVSALVNEMISGGALMETETIGASGRGRPSTILRVAPSPFVIPVLSFAENGLRYRVFDTSNYCGTLETGFLPLDISRLRPQNALESWYIDTEQLCAPILHWVKQLREKYTPLVLLMSIRASFSGGVMSSSSLKLSFSDDFVRRITEETGLPLVIGNDCVFHAYGEKIVSDIHEDFIFILIQEGIGAGIICNGSVFGNRLDRAAELGHVSIDYNGRLCSCGARGCLERYVSIPALCEDAGMDFDALCASYADGDPAIVRLLNERTDMLALAISNMMAVHPIEQVLLGGDIKKLGDRFLEAVRHSVATVGPQWLMDGLTVRYAKTLPEDDELGAYLNFIDHQLEIDSIMRKA